MPFKQVSLLFILSITLIFSVDAQRSVTSPGICLRDADCNENSEFCGGNYKCTERFSKNTECFNNIQCKPGLYCGETDDSDTERCIPQKKPKEACDEFYEGSCATDGKVTYKCSPKTFTCGYTGFKGDACSNNEECQKGHYCKDADALSGGGKCALKLREGARCGVRSDDSECQGYCATGIFAELEDGVCTTGSRIGEACTQNSHCYGYENSLNDPNSLGKSKIVCNIPKGYIGICEHERALIKKEGVSCNRSKDRCDAMRGLSCRSTSTGAKCMFNAYDTDSSIRFCNKDGNFSKCNLKNGIPTECRLSDAISRSLYRGFYQCVRKVEIIPQGKSCNDVGYARCEKGTSCETVAGVEQQFLKFARVAKFCVQVKQEGEKCFNKFRYGCANGLKCEKNVCVKGTPDRAYTHSYLAKRCDSQPCVPGFECVTESGFSRCQRKTVKKNKGSCFSTAFTQTECTDDTTCTRDENGFGLLACRNKLGSGSVCATDQSCMSPLQCSGQCYIPDLNIALGRKCNPNLANAPRRCVVADDGYSRTACMPKKRGYACQKLAELYERCDAQKNIACSPESNSVCNKYGVCVPR